MKYVVVLVVLAVVVALTEAAPAPAPMPEELQRALAEVEETLSQVFCNPGDNGNDVAAQKAGDNGSAKKKDKKEKKDKKDKTTTPKP